MVLDNVRVGARQVKYPAVAVVSALALLSPVGQEGTSADSAKAYASTPDRHAAVDGGNPLFLTPPPTPAALVLPSVPAQSAASLPAFGVPATVLAAYQRAADSVAHTSPGCHLAWPVLAGIGKVESNHARNGDVTSEGEMIDPIYGPVLDGTGGTANITDGAGWARAAGPMQFIPSSWALWAADGNNDGRADVQNVFDASLSAAHYLCADGRDLATGPGLRDAILSYNHSAQYLDTVAAWIRAYHNGGGPIPDQPSAAGTYRSEHATSAEPSQSAPVTSGRPDGHQPPTSPPPGPAPTAPPRTTPPSNPPRQTPPPSTPPPSSQPPLLPLPPLPLVGQLLGS